MARAPATAPRGHYRHGFPLREVLAQLTHAARAWPAPALERVAAQCGDPFQVLVGTVLSLRTRDETTRPALERLLALAPTARTLAARDEDSIAAAIRPVAFFRVKARNLRALGQALCAEHGGRVPASLEALLALPGVGRKTANLTLGLAFGEPAVCVDVHVHRILNRLGALDSPDPATTEALLRRHLPRRLWLGINPVLVAFGQTLCAPRSPHCSRCPVADRCRREGVDRSR